MRRNLNTCESIDPDLKKILDLQRIGLKYRIGTRGFLAPEIIFNSNIQGKAVDIWAAGVIFLSFLINRMPVFNMNKFCKIKDDTIKEITPLIIVYGAKEINKIAEKFDTCFHFDDVIDSYRLRKDYEAMIDRKDVDEVYI